MNFKKIWEKVPYWTKAGIVGFVVGLIHHPLLLIIQDSNLFLIKFYSFEYLLFCSLLKLGQGEKCGFVYFISGLLVFPLLSALIFILLSFIYHLFKRKRR